MSNLITPKKLKDPKGGNKYRFFNQWVVSNGESSFDPLSIDSMWLYLEAHGVDVSDLLFKKKINRMEAYDLLWGYCEKIITRVMETYTHNENKKKGNKITLLDAMERYCSEDMYYVIGGEIYGNNIPDEIISGVSGLTRSGYIGKVDEYVTDQGETAS